MAFMLGAAIGGAAKRASEIFKEEAEAAQNTMDDAFKVLVELGLPAARKDKELRMNKGKIYDSLVDTYKFSPAQANVIMKQGRGQAVIDHINTMQDTYEQYKLNPADIVSITQDYEGDLTKDQVLENVLGKVTGGMNVSDAITDLTGKKPTGTLTSLFGGDEMAGPIARMDALTAATGVSSADLAAYASGERTYDPALVEGTVTLADPFKSEAGAITQTSALRRLTEEAVKRFGGNVKVVDGVPRYEDIILDDELLAIGYANDALIVFEQARAAGKSGPEALREAAEAMRQNDFTSTAARAGDDGGDGAVDTGGYDGMTSSTIAAQLEKDIEGLVGPGRNTRIAQARNAIIADLKKSMPEAEAIAKADEIIAGIIQ